MAGADEDNWLEDYIKGADFEMYSIPLEVLSEDSSLWNMSFKRQVMVGSARQDPPFSLFPVFLL